LAWGIVKKIDCHCHTTNKLLLNSANPDASLDAIAEHARRHDIVRTVVLATYFPHKGTGISNYRLNYWIGRRPEFVMFGSLDFEHFFYQGYNELEEMSAERLIKGIKLYPAYQNVDFASEKFKQVAGLAQRHDLPLMFHGGVSYTLWKKLGTQAILALTASPLAAVEPYKTPGDFETVAQAFPGVTVIVSHLCKPFFQDMMAVSKRNSNVFVDTSGLLDSKLDAPYRDDCVQHVRRFVDSCGPEKVLFGTDFPVQTHADAVYFVKEALRAYSAAEKRLVYFDNAKRLIFKGELTGS
jgi:predicted TIM-barrel fold metal-dependent hydrolase